VPPIRQSFPRTTPQQCQWQCQWQCRSLLALAGTSWRCNQLSPGKQRPLALAGGRVRIREQEVPGSNPGASISEPLAVTDSVVDFVVSVPKIRRTLEHFRVLGNDMLVYKNLCKVGYGKGAKAQVGPSHPFPLLSRKFRSFANPPTSLGLAKQVLSQLGYRPEVTASILFRTPC
jgi:hypothetical protein